MKIVSRSIVSYLVLGLFVVSCSQTSVVSGQGSNTKTGARDEVTCAEQSEQQFTFSWPLLEGCANKPRGGSSKGASVKFATQARAQWQALHESGISKFEQDRRAILAMQGGYKVNFDFLETVGFSDDFSRDRPYQSWGTEYVYVIEDNPKFISLQHIMVMYFEQEDGSISDPMVMKHWRQDWTYEDTTLLEYQDQNVWHSRTLKHGDVKGQWSQAVFQVDDSPRYESYGRWQHNNSFSSWLSEKTRRPLPRRESSVRQDYDVLEGFNRHTVTQTGWVQEEENWKLRLADNAEPSAQMPYIAKEQGLARYRSVTDFDFSAGDEYMTNTAVVWKAVRDEWRDLIDTNKTIKLKKSVDGQPMFMTLFSLADSFANNKVSEREAKVQVKRTIQEFIR